MKVEVVSARLRDGGYRLELSACPCGGLSDDVLLAEVDRYGLPLRTVLCKSCGTLRTDPYPDDDSLADFYTNAYQELYARADDRAAYFEKQGRYGQRILEYAQSWLRPADTIYESGCGAGGAVEIFAQAGYRALGCDYSRELVEYGTARGLELRWGSSFDAFKGAPPASFIYLHHVFEHVRDPVAHLSALSALLGPEGRILVVVPDVARIDRFPFPAGDLRLFLHIAHRFNFSKAGLRCVGERAGMQLQDLQERDAHGAPELWALYSRKIGGKEVVSRGTAGTRMLTYLRRTERMYSLGITRGQVATLPTRVKGAVVRSLPAPLRYIARQIRAALR